MTAVRLIRGPMIRDPPRLLLGNVKADGVACCDTVNLAPAE